MVRDYLVHTWSRRWTDDAQVTEWKHSLDQVEPDYQSMDSGGSI